MDQKKKYYAVRVGRTPGIYDSWAEAGAEVQGFPGAVYKSFREKKEAEEFLRGESVTFSAGQPLPDYYAFVDGSFNQLTGVYGYGGFLCADGKKYVLQGSGDDTELASMRNVAGELMGSMAAVQKALELGLPELSVFYDYMGIEQWAVGAWKQNKKGTRAYRVFMEEAMKKLRISFVKVAGHSGIEGNEEADRLAKQSCGIA